MSKKSFSMVGTIIIALIVLFVLVFATQKLIAKQKSKSEVEACRFSVLARSKLVVPKTEVPLVKSPLNCRTRLIEIKDAKKINETIAEEMRKCWYQFGEGEVDFLPWRKGEFLFLCSKIVFSEEVSKEYPTIDWLPHYLSTKRIPNSVKTYKGYIFGDLPPEAETVFNNMKFSTKEPLYIGFYLTKGVEWLPTLKRMLGGSTAFAIGACTFLGISAAMVTGGIGAVVYVACIAGAIGGGTGGATIGYIFGKKTEVGDVMLIIGNVKELEKFAEK